MAAVDAETGATDSAPRAAGRPRRQHNNAQKWENNLFVGATGDTQPVCYQMVFNEFRMQEPVLRQTQQYMQAIPIPARQAASRTRFGSSQFQARNE